DEYFGYDVAMGDSAQWAIIGAYGAVARDGKAYIFRRDTTTNIWNMVTTFGPGSSGANLGAAVAMNTQGNIAVGGAVGASITDAGGYTFAAGEAFIYTRNPNDTWSQATELHQTNAGLRHSNDFYGASVGCDGGTVVVGVPGGDSPTTAQCGYIQIW